jgi:hypothetical protein
LLQSINAINQRDHAVELVSGRQLFVGDHRLRNRHRIGKAGGFDQHAVERRQITFASLLVEVTQRIDQVAAHRAADAAAGQQHGVFVGCGDQQVVEPDLAELVDDHRCTSHCRILQQPVE